MATNPIDLCTVAQVQAFLDPDGQVSSWNASQSTEQQNLITEGSKNWLTWTGRRTLNRILPFNDTYDGSGSDRQFVADYPLIKVFNVWANGLLIPPGSYSPTGQIVPGWVIDRDRESISIIGQHRKVGGYGSFNVSGSTPYRIGYWSFGTKDNNNRQNVQIQMLAGPSFQEAETTAITASPYLVQNAANFVADLGVMSYGGIIFTAVPANPGPQQYSVSAGGSYSFNVADAGTTVNISYGYNGAPIDIQLAVAEMVGINWKRLKTVDQKSVMIGEAGTNSYRDWIFTPKVQRTLDHHTRRAQVGV